MLGIVGSSVLLACQPQPQAQTPCPPRDYQPAASVTETVKLETTATTKVVDGSEISAVEPDRLLVNDASGAIKPGQFLVSNCGEGMVRQVVSTEVAPSSSTGLSPQNIRKVYVKTQAASLEDAITAGDVGINFGNLDLNQAVTVQSLPGIKPQAFNGKIGFANVTVPLPAGASITLNGFLQQSIEPTFQMSFTQGSLEKLQIGVKGDITAKLEGVLKTSAKLTTPLSGEKEVAKYSFTRAFLVGAIPVVVVVEPKLIVGASAGGDDSFQVTAGIAPTASINLQISYDRKRAGNKWDVVATTTASLNPSFGVTTPGKGKAKAFTRLALGVKFYGIAGPELGLKPFLDSDLNVNKTALFRTGVTAEGTIKAGFKILGKGLEVSTDALTERPVEKNFNCTTTGCTEQP